mmetsp:Transcript_19986/g.37282  ORF Transcript_19986/g.37282 Transcript_19986/m.37282 type:complete len:214 (+) Transcript_19986:1861-2502(+)
MVVLHAPFVLLLVVLLAPSFINLRVGIRRAVDDILIVALVGVVPGERGQGMLLQKVLQHVVLLELDALPNNRISLLLSVEGAQFIDDVQALDGVDNVLVVEIAVSADLAFRLLEEVLDVVFWQVERDRENLGLCDGQNVNPQSHFAARQSGRRYGDGSRLSRLGLQALVDLPNVLDGVAVALELPEIVVPLGVAFLAPALRRMKPFPHVGAAE